MLLLVDIVPARRAHMVLVKPRLQALDVEVVLAPQEEHLVPPLVDLQADGAHAVRVYFRHCFDGDALQLIIFDSSLLFDFLCHVRILEI